MKVRHSCVWLLATSWTAAYQAPLSMRFSRQEYWSGVRCHCLLWRNGEKSVKVDSQVSRWREWERTLENLEILESVFLGFSGGSDGQESAWNAGDLGFIPGLERSPGGGNGYPFQYSGLENSMDSGAWRAAVHGIVESVMTEWLSLPESFYFLMSQVTLSSAYLKLTLVEFQGYSFFCKCQCCG